MTVLPEQREGLLALVEKWRDEAEVVGLDAYYTDGMRACADELEASIAAIESAGAGETSGYITEVPDKSDRIIWRGHYYQLPPAACPAHAAPEQGAVTAINALRHADDWVSRVPHGDNCFVSDHYEGDPGNRCNCGRESVLDSLMAGINALTQPGAVR